MNDSLPTPALSGRELARARRREMSHTGASKIKAGTRNSGASAKAPAPVAAPSAQSLAAPQPALTPAAFTTASDSSAKPLTGKALSMARRAMLAQGGKSSLPTATKAATRMTRPTRNAPLASTAVATPPDNSVEPETAAQHPVLTPSVVASENSAKPLSGKALSMARRAMLAKSGKRSLPAAAQTKARATRPSKNTAIASPAKQDGACCDACASADSAVETKDTTNATELDNLCSLIDTNPETSTDVDSSVKAYCRQRRSTLAKKGKLGLPGEARRQALKSLARGTGSTLTGRALAKLRREDLSVVGRGTTSSSRPSGRVRPNTDEAPPKVEVGTTLSGQSVTGTQVEQTEKLTGIESGGCRDITGTEYLGVEQFEKFCSTTPKASPKKVAFSETSKGQFLTGGNTAGTQKVTGEETGSCKSITGTEYLGAEHFGTFCSSQGMTKPIDKVIVGSTPKDMRITGVDEARDNAVTGAESGINAAVTGSDYVNSTPRQASSTAPAKVEMTHTAAGIAVSGGESSRQTGITGDDQDLCRRVTGTEYISSERFQTACGTAPQQNVPKVGIDSSRGGMSITGNLVDRSQNVTGNEPGTCQRVTGSQYGESARSGLCDTRSNKVHEMSTLQGGRLTGTEGSPSPKLTGDDRGSCSVVTGSEYVSQGYFQQSCPQTPQPSGKMTGFSETWNNQVVSGVQTGHSQRTTGNEHGICETVTGSSYAGREQISEFCSSVEVAQSDLRLRHHHEAPVMPVSGMTPAVDDRLAGNFQRGNCQEVTGTPYQGAQEQMLCNSGNQHHLAQAPLAQSRPQPVAPSAEPYRSDFSVVSPARSAWGQRTNTPVSSSVYAQRNSITGATNKAEGVISGTPEFRHQREAQPLAVAMTAEPQPERITGEGSERGTQITGDDWSRGGLVTGTEGLFSARRNQTQQGVSVKRDNIGAHNLKGRERPEAPVSRVTGGSGTTCTTGLVTLSGGASA